MHLNIDRDLYTLWYVWGYFSVCCVPFVNILIWHIILMKIEWKIKPKTTNMRQSFNEGTVQWGKGKSFYLFFCCIHFGFFSFFSMKWDETAVRCTGTWQALILMWGFNICYWNRFDAQCTFNISMFTTHTNINMAYGWFGSFLRLCNAVFFFFSLSFIRSFH